MAKTSAELQGQLASKVRWDPSGNHTELRTEFRTQRLAEYIERTLALAPPLTAEQRDRLAVLLRGDAA